jgi:hypothetical protein
MSRWGVPDLEEREATSMRDDWNVTHRVAAPEIAFSSPGNQSQ